MTKADYTLRILAASISLVAGIAITKSLCYIIIWFCLMPVIVTANSEVADDN